MRKKVVLMYILIGVIAAVLLILLLVADNWIIQLSLILALLAFAAIAVGYLYYRQFMKKRVPNIMQNHTRNYDRINLGKMKKTELEKKNGENGTLDLTNYARNWYTDVLVLERWYSFLKKRGTVCFNLDGGSRQFLISNHISIFDDSFLHPVTLMEHAKNTRSIKYELSKSCKGLMLLFLHNFKEKKRILELTSAEIQSVIDKRKEIQQFCRTRDIEVEFNYNNFSEEILMQLNSNE